MKVIVPKKKILHFMAVTKCYIPDVTNTYVSSDLQRPTLYFSFGDKFSS